MVGLGLHCFHSADLFVDRKDVFSVELVGVMSIGGGDVFQLFAKVFALDEDAFFSSEVFANFLEARVDELLSGVEDGDNLI